MLVHILFQESVQKVLNFVAQRLNCSDMLRLLISDFTKSQKVKSGDFLHSTVKSQDFVATFQKSEQKIFKFSHMLLNFFIGQASLLL